MFHVFENPTDMTITEVSGTQHELKNVIRISISPMMSNFKLRVEYSALENPAISTTVPDCILLALIDQEEVQRIENVCNISVRVE